MKPHQIIAKQLSEFKKVSCLNVLKNGWGLEPEQAEEVKSYLLSSMVAVLESCKEMVEKKNNEIQNFSSGGTISQDMKNFGKIVCNALSFSLTNEINK